MEFNRRDLLKLGLTSLPIAAALSRPAQTLAADASFGGVRVGVIAPYSFKGMGSDPADLLEATASLGLKHVELQSQAIEPWAGAPAGGFGRPPRRGQPAGPNAGSRRGGRRPARPLRFNLRGLNKAQQEAVNNFGQALAEPYAALTAARSELNTASFDAATSITAMEAKAEAVSAAETALAKARATAYEALQASEGKLDDRQVQRLIQQTATGGDQSGSGRSRGRRGASNPAFEALMKSRAEETRKWRLSQSMDKFKELKAMYAAKGVEIGLVKFGLGSGMTDDEVDYCFQVAKAVGARGITCEPPVSETRRLGQFADRHKLFIGYHSHANVSSPEAFGRPGAWEQAFFYSDYNGANIDIGHYAAGNSVPATEFIKRYHHRITNIHVKDRQFDQGENQPLGQGDSQVREILQLMKRERYEFMATIELEYRIPEGSTAMKELAKCVEFCQDALA